MFLSLIAKLNIYYDIFIMENFNDEDYNLNSDNYIKSYKLKSYLLNIFINYNKEKYNLINNSYYVNLLKHKKLINLHKKY